MKKLVALMCMLICILSMTACAETDTTDYTANYEPGKHFVIRRNSFFTMLQDEDEATIQNFLEMDNSQISTDNDQALENQGRFPGMAG